MNFVPNMAGLRGAGGTQFEFGLEVPNPRASHLDDLRHIELRAKMSRTSTGMRLQHSTSASDGVWIPYIQNVCVYGYASGGTLWMGSGPFSGCHVAFFMQGGRLGMAHVAVDGSGDAMKAWGSFSGRSGVTVLNKWKVPLAINGTKAMGTYIFLDLTNPTKVSLTQMDVAVTQMGGDRGAVFAVKSILS